MLFVQCAVDDDRFVIAAERVVEVIPFVHWKYIPDGTRGVVGLLNYRQRPVPLVDLSVVVRGQPTAMRMHARIIIVRTDEPGSLAAAGLLGILAARVVGTIHYAPEEFVVPDDIVRTVPSLGPIRTDEHGIVQRIEIDHLLSLEARASVLDQWTIET